MGRFFNDKVENKRFSLNKYGLIAVGVIFLILLFVIIGAYNSKQRKNSTPIYKLNSKIAIDLGGELPNVEDYFESITNDDYSKVTVDTSKVDVNTAGTYTVTLTIGSNEELVQVTVGDISAPKLKLQEVTINEGESYSIEDFVKSCTDNSGDECILAYATTLGTDGKEVDPSTYTEKGTYEIKIYASDTSNNTTENIVTTLTIGDDSSTTPSSDPATPTVTCEYGTLSYDTTEYPHPLAVIVGNQTTNCALPYTEWDQDDTLKAANEVAQNDVNKMINQVSNNTTFLNKYPDGGTPIVESEALAIINNDSTSTLGLVGYSINIKVTMNDELILDYYINADGTRTYNTNIIGLE